MRTLYSIRALLLTISAGILMIAATASAATLDTRTKDGIGTYLVDDKGMTLYIFKKDTIDKSVCGAANGCLDRWPVFFAGTIDAKGAIAPANFGTITRDDGVKQTTFKGMPLYYFFKDKEPGDTNGQGFNNVWFVVAP